MSQLGGAATLDPPISGSPLAGRAMLRARTRLTAPISREKEARDGKSDAVEAPYQEAALCWMDRQRCSRPLGPAMGSLRGPFFVLPTASLGLPRVRPRTWFPRVSCCGGFPSSGTGSGT